MPSIRDGLDMVVKRIPIYHTGSRTEAVRLTDRLLPVTTAPSEQTYVKMIMT